MEVDNCSGRLFLAAFAASVALWVPGLAYGQGEVPGYPPSIHAFDAREVAMLPRYCIYTQEFRGIVPGGNNPEQIERWSSVMGDTFIHMHHYCYGLMKVNRGTLLARDAYVRRSYLQDSINEFDYVLRAAPQNFILLPEILTKKGEVLIKLGQGPKAIEPLQHAAELKPDYWPPYAHLSDYYKETGDLKKARELLETGLSFSPDAKGLQRRLTELDAEVTKRKSGSTPARKQGPSAGP